MNYTIKILFSLLLCILFLVAPEIISAQENVKVIRQEIKKQDIPRQKLKEAGAKLQANQEGKKLQGTLKSPKTTSKSFLKTLDKNANLNKRQVLSSPNSKIKSKDASIKGVPNNGAREKRIQKMQSSIANSKSKAVELNKRVQTAEKKAIVDKANGTLSLEEFNKKMVLINKAKEKASKLIIRIDDAKSVKTN